MAEIAVVDPGARIVDRWEGWGCSLSWWAVYSAHWPEPARAEACRRLFSRTPDALGLSICRYNAGGTAPTADPAPYRPGGRVLAMLDRDGSWRPERDAAQISCLRLARRFGADRFELFANSPPWWMLRSGSTRGGDGGDENLEPRHERDYAEWLAETAARLEREADVRFASVAPFNEPSAWWWNAATSGQEGCRVSWPAQARVVGHLNEALRRRGVHALAACSDENGAHEAYNTLDWLTRPEGGGLRAGAIGRLNVHAYHGWEWQERLRDLSAARGVSAVWMSEVTYREWGEPAYAPNDMRCALPVSRSIVGDVRRLGCRGWVYWQPVEPLSFSLTYRYTYGFLQAAVDAGVPWGGRTYGPGDWVVARSYHVMMQFSRFVLPGFRVVRSGDDWTLAAHSPSGDRLVLVAHHDGDSPRELRYDLRRFARAGGTAAAWRTQNDDASGAWECRAIPALPVRGGTLEVTLPPRSVTTYRIDDMRLTPEMSVDAGQK